MKERPIQFKGEMVRAILEGRKSQTRRTKGLKDINEEPDCWKPFWFNDRGQNLIVSWESVNRLVAPNIETKCPYGKKGHRLWVKETYRVFSGDEGTNGIFYKADGKFINSFLWKSSMFMPRWASRILLEITDISVERLQDISEKDATSEGVAFTKYLNANARYHFMELWNKINGKCPWELNPWVWVINFRKIK